MSKDEKLFSIIANALDEDINSINIDSSSDNLLSWDSLGQLSILSALDSALDGGLGDGMSQLSNKTSVKLLLEAITDKNFK